MSCGVRRRHGSNPALLWLWLWCRLAPTDLIKTPSLRTSICRGYGPKKTEDKKKKKKGKRKKNILIFSYICLCIKVRKDNEKIPLAAFRVKSRHPKESNEQVGTFHFINMKCLY